MFPLNFGIFFGKAILWNTFKKVLLKIIAFSPTSDRRGAFFIGPPTFLIITALFVVKLSL